MRRLCFLQPTPEEKQIEDAADMTIIAHLQKQITKLKTEVYLTHEFTSKKGSAS